MGSNVIGSSNKAERDNEDFTRLPGAGAGCSSDSCILSGVDWSNYFQVLLRKGKWMRSGKACL